MGRTTKFKGALTLSRALTLSEAKQLLEFNEDPDTIEGTHPDSYMQWVPTETLDGIVWDGVEKFYNYTEWMQWLVQWLKACDIDAGGELLWSGEDAGDVGVITVAGGLVTADSGRKKGVASGKPLTLAALGEIALAQLTST
jgi:hypothetical protein